MQGTQSQATEFDLFIIIIVIIVVVVVTATTTVIFHHYLLNFSKEDLNKKENFPFGFVLYVVSWEHLSTPWL